MTPQDLLRLKRIGATFTPDAPEEETIEQTNETRIVDLLGKLVEAQQQIAESEGAEPPEAPKVEVRVAAPSVNVEAPKVTVQMPKPATAWECEITERDRAGRMKKFTLRAI